MGFPRHAAIGACEYRIPEAKIAIGVMGFGDGFPAAVSVEAGGCFGCAVSGAITIDIIDRGAVQAIRRIDGFFAIGQRCGRAVGFREDDLFIAGGEIARQRCSCQLVIAADAAIGIEGRIAIYIEAVGCDEPVGCAGGDDACLNRLIGRKILVGCYCGLIMILRGDDRAINGAVAIQIDIGCESPFIGADDVLAAADQRGAIAEFLDRFAPAAGAPPGDRGAALHMCVAVKLCRAGFGEAICRSYTREMRKLIAGLVGDIGDLRAIAIRREGDGIFRYEFEGSVAIEIEPGNALEAIIARVMLFARERVIAAVEIRDAAVGCAISPDLAAVNGDPIRGAISVAIRERLAVEAIAALQGGKRCHEGAARREVIRGDGAIPIFQNLAQGNGIVLAIAVSVTVLGDGSPVGACQLFIPAEKRETIGCRLRLDEAHAAILGQFRMGMGCQIDRAVIVEIIGAGGVQAIIAGLDNGPPIDSTASLAALLDRSGC